MPPFFTHRPSPNFDARALGKQIDYIILHYTGMENAEAALARLTDPAAKVSAHYVVGERGDIIQLVAEEDRAWHAGESFWRGERDINSRSVGIELVNPGHALGYRPFPHKQIAAARALTTDIMKRHFIEPQGVLAHSDVAPQRKEDPGELFPWREFSGAGIGVWPDITGEDRARAAGASVADVQAMLRAIGYDCAEDGQYDGAMRRVLLAFQRHWHPTSLTGTIEPETAARIAALARAVGV
ncbi:MAG: N-acetylmuramoyl-L-alanine amidase [Alphaproteobacteria bacterium]|nr:N-acetylmuramoyl-L-alanine amidase [Alphaproteobacteria bacterium]